MKSKSYWEKRAAQRMVSYMDDAEQTAREIRKAYQKAASYLSSEAEKVMRTFQGLSGVSESEAHRLLREAEPEMDVIRSLKAMAEKVIDPDKRQKILNRINAPAYAARIKRMQRLQKDIEEQCDSMYRAELRRSTIHYKALCREAYQQAMFDIQQGVGIGFSFSRMPTSRINQILNMPWSGEHYSNRIWENTQDLAQALKEELLTGFMTGRSYDKTAVHIMERMGTGASQARRLVRTESCYVANAAEMESYDECGVEKYRFVATLDKRTSAICRRLDGRVYPVEDGKPGVNRPPMHPWCRSTTIAEFGYDVLEGLTRRARDLKTGETYLVPQDMTYEQWQKTLKPQLEYDTVNDVSLEPLPITTESLKNVKAFKCQCLNGTGQKALFNAHKRLLTSVAGKPPGTEASATYDLSMRKLGGFVGEDAAGRVRIPDADVPYIGIHSHPTGGTFTHADIELFARRKHMVMLTAIGNNGTVYALEKTKTFNLADFSLYYKKVLNRHPEVAKMLELLTRGEATPIGAENNYMEFIQDLFEGASEHGVKYYSGTT